VITKNGKPPVMKIIPILTLLLLFFCAVQGQPAGKQKQKPSAQAEMDKALEEAMKGMSEEEKAEMQKMMKDIMPELAKKPGPAISPFTDNKKLVPVKDLARISKIPKKLFTDADVTANAALLYSRLMAKIPASEKGIITNVMAKAKNGNTLMEAAITSMMQGHTHAAMGLSLKAVLAEPKNIIYQNNLAAILSQSGYPEKAIPYLKKLSSQSPANGTVLHNLGYAWFSLGQVDTARRMFAYAAMRNPNNPETKLCRGVIEELRGDPKKAADNYVESFEQLSDPFTESMAKNIKAEGRLGKMDFDKLKTRIAIHEYFKKNWIKVPELTDNVSAYTENMRIINGYTKMITELEDKIEAMVDESNAEAEALLNMDINKGAEIMMKESIKGLNMMSMTAVYVQRILQPYIYNWTEKYAQEQRELKERISAQGKIITKSGENDKCPDFDRKNNDFLAYANPLIRKFHAKKIEEARVWVNTFCTWIWYIAGNPKNTVMTQCISWSAFLVELHKSALLDQFALSKSCVNQKDDGVAYFAVPAIPNFTCPTVVSIPFGLDELQLSSGTVNFDNNDWNIKQADGASIPNLTLSFGVDKTDITEPGKYGNPYAKTGNGSINTSGFNDVETDDLTPLSRIMDDLTPLSKIPQDELTPLDPSLLNKNKLNRNDLTKSRKAETARKLLKEMMSAKCPGKLPVKKERKPKFWVGLGELELEPILEVTLGELELEPIFEVGLGELELWDEDMQAWINSKGEKRFEEGFKEKLIKDVKEALETSGLQISISNGLEAVKAMSNADKGLFD
jgi:tetratricopeptide (TPR) repeat protein